VVQNEERQALLHFLHQGSEVDLLMQQELGLVLDWQEEPDLKPLVATEEMLMKPNHFCSELIGLVVLEHFVVWTVVLPEDHLEESAKGSDL
jgi:hypothetical protein